ncbi:hypothetical protein ScalyP_jg8501 [Parmales sp. scaly parma]|nr:hypothetical protein ScalyP_jg8501 [Parmales sp. scaly parma]
MRQSVLTLGYFDSIAICDHSTPPTITVNLTIPSLFHPQLATIQTSLHSNLDLASASTNSQINVNLNCVKSTTSNEDTDAYKENDENEDPGGTGLKDISHILAVYSCKGGVGKSTVSANLAYALAATGAKVGLLDLDIYGPSLPTLVKPEDLTVRRSELGKSMVKPLVHEKVKMLSLGFVSPNSGVPGSGRNSPDAAVMRGPMAGRVVKQLLKGTEWGKLDVLLLDMPPGTGDVQLTVCQEAQLSGAVTVTTPGKLAEEDVVKGNNMFNNLGVPTVAAVENMAYFECGGLEEGEGKHKHYIFGEAGLNSSAINLIEGGKSIQLPLSNGVKDGNEAGQPFYLANYENRNSDSEIQAYDELAENIMETMFKFDLKSSQDINCEIDINSLNLNFNKKSPGVVYVRIFEMDGAKELIVSGENLRRRNPNSGEVMELAVGSRLLSFQIEKVERAGNYGFSVRWKDGASIIYSVKSLLAAAAAAAEVYESEKVKVEKIKGEGLL